MRVWIIAAFSVAALGTVGRSVGQDAGMVPELRCTAVGSCFCVRPAFEPAVTEKVALFRSVLRKERAAGKLTGYLSVPLSSGNGANFSVNREAADHTKSRIEEYFGDSLLYVLNPATPEADLPNVAAQRASQGEYLYMWTQILGGEDGYGRDLDFVYFVGPNDFRDLFAAAFPGKAVLEGLVSFFDDRYKTDPQFKAEVDSGRLNRLSFLSYYGLKASISFSRGAHDEWNVATTINSRRSQLATEFGVPGLLPVWFDGRAVEPGDFSDPVMAGNTASGCGR